MISKYLHSAICLLHLLVDVLIVKTRIRSASKAFITKLMFKIIPADAEGRKKLYLKELKPLWEDFPNIFAN